MNLVYIHNKKFYPVASGHVNVTFLQVISMCNALQEAGNNVILLIPESEFDINVINTEIKSIIGKQFNFRITTFKPGRGKILNKYLAPFYTIKKIKEQNPDLIYIRTSIFLILIWFFKKDIIYESHNNLQHTYIKGIDRLYKFMIKQAAKKKNFIKLVAISDSLANYWKEQGIPSKKIFAYHDGFSSFIFKQNITQDHARRLVNIPLNKKVIMYTGGLYRDRGIESIIELAQKKPSLLFYIIGGPETAREKYVTLSKEKNIYNIVFLQRKSYSEIPVYLYAADVLLALWSSNVPTINYCSPLKLFDYMASGRTIVAHAFPTIKEVLKDRVTGILIEPESQKALEEGLDRALKDESHQLGANARKTAFEKYSWDKRANAILSSLFE